MGSRKTSTASSGNIDRDLKITDQAFQVLMKEYDTLKDLFSQTETSIQGIFNFYVTLISAVVGGIALIYQSSSLNPSYAERTQTITCGLLILAATVGTIYLLAITARYARLIQYSQSLDAVRLFLITELKIPVPEIYSRFINRSINPKPALNLRTLLRALIWIMPTGTYQLTMAFINSLVITLATGFILSIYGETTSRIMDHLVTLVIEFAVVFNLYNIYSRIVMGRWVAEFDLQINPQRDDPFHMIR
jgi:hypothetical protein